MLERFGVSATGCINAVKEIVLLFEVFNALCEGSFLGLGGLQLSNGINHFSV